jgi:hypothetical protein
MDAELERAARVVSERIGEGSHLDDLAGAALHLAAVALVLLGAQSQELDAERLADRVLAYASQTPWWDEPDPGDTRATARAVHEWSSHVRLRELYTGPT